MIREAKIIVIGEADEVLARCLQLVLELVDLREEWIGEFEQGIARKAEPARGIVREASVFCHLVHRPWDIGAHWRRQARDSGRHLNGAPRE